MPLSGRLRSPDFAADSAPTCRCQVRRDWPSQQGLKVGVGEVQAVGVAGWLGEGSDCCLEILEGLVGMVGEPVEGLWEEAMGEPEGGATLFLLGELCASSVGDGGAVVVPVEDLAELVQRWARRSSFLRPRSVSGVMARSGQVGRSRPHR